MYMYAYEIPWINMHAIANNKPDGTYSIHNIVAICSAAFTHSLFFAVENTDKWGNCRFDDDVDDVDEDDYDYNPFHPPNSCFYIGLVKMHEDYLNHWKFWSSC